MESRANYVVVGAFVLVMAVALLAAALWLAQAHFHTRFALFELHVGRSVAGLEFGAPVRLNGIDVGRVTGIAQDDDDPTRVNVLLRVREPVRIHADSTASLETQGLTGGSFIEISGGTAAAPLLPAKTAPPYPVIVSHISGFQEVVDDAPLVMARLGAIADRLQEIMDEQNRRNVAQILTDLHEFTSTLNRRTQDVDQLIVDSGQTMHNLAGASVTLRLLLAHLDETATKADRVVDGANTTLDQTSHLAVDLRRVVQSSEGGVRTLTTTIPARLDDLLISANRLAESLDRVSTGLERDPSSVLFGVRDQGYRPK